MESELLAPTIPAAKVSSLFIYPIKSCRGISVSHAPLTPTGLRWDRQWVVVNSKGRACTQRVDPKLALVEVQMPPDALAEDYQPTNNSYMVLKAPGMESLKICLSKQHEVTEAITVWEWTGSAWDEGIEASRWFSDYLGKPCQLVRFNAEKKKNPLIRTSSMFPNEASEVRGVDPNYVGGQHRTYFSDGYPFLLLSQESLDALNELLQEPIPINRFRPNILVEGCDPYSEDLWTEIKISGFSFQGVKLCSRCKVPTINQETGISGSEPTETLMKTRSGKVLRPDAKNKNKVYFGQNIVWNWMDSSATGSGKIIRVGDPVYVLRKVSSAAEAAA
ncbi:mitochondrial amidoxime-reducing component 1-like isoform X1 [Vigna umbellata]|uniref:mitochondrial amidoxime-reducing component 1-like isoform X1 n=1 Tax=Vigna umbellata TaxID=87088 RepID=UPI001F5F7BF0|nr:mitochondrial amidoxime-reducing component 1-like isoform X1 [Vigna umbellata]